MGSGLWADPHWLIPTSQSWLFFWTLFRCRFHFLGPCTHLHLSFTNQNCKWSHRASNFLSLVLWYELNFITTHLALKHCITAILALASKYTKKWKKANFQVVVVFFRYNSVHNVSWQLDLISASTWADVCQLAHPVPVMSAVNNIRGWWLHSIATAKNAEWVE